MKKFIIICFTIFFPAFLPAMDLTGLFRHSQIAGKNSVFVDFGPAPLYFHDLEFKALPIEIRAEWLPPLPLPFSIGLFMKTPDPNLRSFGARLAYHIGLRDPAADLYFAYSFDFGFLRNGLLEEYGDEPAETYWYDFRLGVRRFFGKRLGLAVESGHKFQSVVFLVSVKIN